MSILKRKIGENEQMYDLEKSLAECNSKKKVNFGKEYTLKNTGSIRYSMFIGKLERKLNLDHLAEFIDIKHDSVKYIEHREFIRDNNQTKILKDHVNPTFTYVKITMSLISYDVTLQLFQQGIILVKNAQCQCDATDAVDKLMFEINRHQFKHLFYV
jgi:hypothetical protein